MILKKAPKWISVILWGIVALRLVLPFSIESAFSLIPSAETISPEIMTDKTPTIHTGIPILNSTLNPIINDSFSPNAGDSANPLQIIVPVLAVIWIVGIAAHNLDAGRTQGMDISRHGIKPPLDTKA